MVEIKGFSFDLEDFLKLKPPVCQVIFFEDRSNFWKIKLLLL